MAYSLANSGVGKTMTMEEKIKELNRLRSTIHNYISPEEFYDFWMKTEPMDGPLDGTFRKMEHLNQNVMKQSTGIDFQGIGDFISAKMQNAVLKAAMKLYEKYDEKFQKPKLEKAKEDWKELCGAEFPYVSGEQGETLYYSNWRAREMGEKPFADIESLDEALPEVKIPIVHEKENLPVQKSSLEQQILGAKEALASREPVFPKQKGIEKGLDSF